MAIKPDGLMKTLDTFYAERTIMDVNRDTFLVCNLRDNQHKLTISLVFLKDWDSLEPDDYRQIVIQNKGAVLTFPCYWVSVPKELAIPYFEFVIDELYSKEFSAWIDGSGGSQTGGLPTPGVPGIGPGCNCPVLQQ